MLKQYINNTSLYVILLVSLLGNACMLYEVNTMNDKFYFAEVIFEESTAGYVTKIECKD